MFVFPADGHEREAVAGLQQTGPGVSEPSHRRGSSASPVMEAFLAETSKHGDPHVIVGFPGQSYGEKMVITVIFFSVFEGLDLFREAVELLLLQDGPGESSVHFRTV